MTDALIWKIGKAKAALVIENPFIAAIICAMPLTLDDTINPPTLCTNGTYVKLHPTWVEEHTQDELKWALAHETFHCVFTHMVRRGTYDPIKWNIAGDVIINVVLDGDTIGKRPKNVIWDAHEILGGLTALQLYAKGGGTTDGVYNLLPDPPPQGGAGGDGDPSGQWDNVEAIEGGAGAQAEAVAKMQVKVAQAAAAAKMCGKLSASMERFIEEALQPKVCWQDQLRHFFTKRAKIDQSYARPNRRFLSQGLYMPGRTGYRMGEVVVAVDLSGSISAKEVDEFAAELMAIKTDCQPSQVHVVYFAERVLSCDTFEQDEEMVIKPNGSGGTAFSPIFAFVDKMGFNPEACVVLTDLCCSDFGPVPEYPVMWASTMRGSAPWGEVIMMNEARRA